MERINEQIDSVMRKAFYDLLEEKVASKPPDYEWLVRLYKEMRDRLCHLLKESSHLRTEITDSMDIVLFEQMLKADAFRYDDFYKLMQYVFCKCKQLGSPARDSETDAKLKEITDFINTGNATFGTIVPMFIKNANFCIDRIYEDIKTFKEKLVPVNNSFH